MRLYTPTITPRHTLTYAHTFTHIHATAIITERKLTLDRVNIWNVPWYEIRYSWICRMLRVLIVLNVFSVLWLNIYYNHPLPLGAAVTPTVLVHSTSELLRCTDSYRVCPFPLTMDHICCCENISALLSWCPIYVLVVTVHWKIYVHV